MNKNKFRVIFNRTLQRLVVTSELARSADKSIRTGGTGEGYQKSAVDFSPVFVSVTPLAFSLFCMLGLVSFSFPVQAALEIRADATASHDQQPIVLSTANGLPQVNIQTPNAKGLSHNKYAQFDVDTKGAILNNSRKTSQTVQGGLVAGNPYLARGEARVILNEVNSANPSLLKGYVEVAGKKADVIIANPNGINCEGCGIINSSRATLTTGKPQLKDGLVDSFTVEKGRVKISGKGLDNSRVDYTEIIAREAEINAGVWSDKKISLVTGQNTVKRDEANADNLQIIHTKPSVKTAETKKYALDVSELGGMYAGKIQLIGTEQGLGVRNEGHIGATAGDIDIDSRGRIINGGTMSARQNIRLNAQGQIDNRGVIEVHQQSAQLITQADINHQGRITAHQGNIRLKAKNTLSQQGESIAKGEVDYQANKILASENSLIAAGVTSQDTTQGTTYHLDALNEQGKSVRLSSTEETQVKGRNIASGEIHIDADSIVLDQSDTLAYRLDGNAKTGAITASYSNLNAVNEIRLSTPTQLVTERANLSSDWIAVAAHAVNNTGGMWTSAGNQDLSLNLKGGLINRAGFIQTSANMSVNTYQADIDNRDTQQKGLLALGALTLQGRKLDNANGQLVANRAVALQMQSIGNREGLIRSQQENVSANSTSSLENQSGQIIGKTGIELIHQGLNNIQGIIAAEQGALNISVGKYNVNNTRGQLLGGTALYVEGNQLVNQGGMIFAEDTLNLRLKNILDNRKIMPTGSLIQSGGTLQIQAQQIDNSNTKPDDEHSSPVQGLLGGNIRITAQQLNNFQGGIYAENELRLESTGLTQNQQGELLSNGNLTLSLPQGVVENENGAIQAAQNLFMNAYALRGNGQIQADHTHIQLTEGFNSTTDIIGRSGLNFSTQGALVNQANFSSQGSVTVRAQSLDNQKTGRISARYTDLTVGSDLTNRGLIKGAEQLNIRVGNQLNNIGSGRIYGGNIALQARKLINQDERLNNKVTSAVIAAIQRLDIGALEISNEQNYLSDEKNQNGVGTTISSEGGIVFGARLNGNNQATGEADKLRNVSALIEGKNIYFGVKSVENINKHLQTRVEQINEEDNLNEHYLLTDEVETGERINFDLLKWVSYSRAGKVIPKNTPLPTKRPENEDYYGYIIPMPNEESCVDESIRSGCVPNPNALYLPDDPVWKVMGVPAPTNELNLNLSDIPTDLEKPEEPTKPRRRMFEGQENYQARVQQYEKDKEAYEKALAEYNKKLAEYGDAIQPYLDWMEQNEQVFLSLGDKIQAHNAKIIGREFYRFWDVYVTNRVERQTLVKETKPGQILSEKEIRFTGDFLNNRSQVIAGERIYNLNSNTNKIRNEDEEGLNSVEERGTQQWTYSKWRGGTKRYHERRWGDKNAYLHYTNTTIALNLVKTEEFGQVTRQTLSPDLAVSAITLNPLNTAGASLRTQQEKTPIAEVRFIRGSVQLPTSSLYKLNPQANDHVLIETDPDFTDQRKWLSSDYMFTLLRTDHEHVHKRLGDGYYEQRLVREQINQLTGRYFLGDYANFENQYKALMNNGATFAQKFNLTVGVSLSPEQVSQLTSDIVWLENQTVRLPNGETQTVLVPRVYMMAQQDDITGEQALISAQEVSLEGQSLTNEGVIAGRKLTFNGTTLSNSGLLTGQTLALKMTGNINQQGGMMEAENALLIDAGGNLNLQSTTQSSRVKLNGYQGQETHLDRKSTLYVKGDNGLLRINADNINLQGAEIRNDGEGATWLAAKNDINLTALSVGFDEKVGKGDHYRNESAQTLEISHVKGRGDVILSAGNNINTEAAQLESEQKLELLAENSLMLGTAETSSSLYEYHKYKSGGGVTKTTKTTELSRADETQQGTQLSADTMVVAAGKDITATAVQLAAEHDVNLIAGNNVSISAGTNHFKNHYRETKKTSGVFGTGGIGVTFGSKSEKHDYASEGWTQSDARAVVGSLNGDIHIQAENHAQVLGTDIIAADNRTIDIQGQSLNIEAGKDVIHTSEQHEYKQSGLTLAFNSPVTDMAVAAVHTVEAAKRVENPRLKALYALKAAQQAKLAEMAFDGSAVQGVLNGTTSNGNSRNSDVKISLSVGSSKSTETSTGSTVTYTGSELNAGDIRLSTTDGDLSVSGSTLTAAHIALDSARNLLLTSVQNTEVNRTERKNSSWSAGVFAGKSGGSYGFGVEGAGAIGKGRENSDTVTQVNTHITGSRVKLHSEQDTALRGAVVNANKLNADIGGNLTIESRQDSNRYASRQSQANAGASIAIYGSGSNAYAGTSLNKGKVNYAQVEEQSGLTVGKEGMDVNVQGNTHLKGGLIQSEAPADKNRFRTDGLTTEDIENHSEISLQSLGGGISSDMFSGDMVGSLGKLGSANGWSAVVSALGGVNRDDKTLTRSAIGDNIALEIKTYKIPTALSRDTAHSNAKVQRYDKAEYEERLETAQLIGDISQNQIDIQWTPKVREAEAKRQQAEAVLNNQNATTAEKAEARQIKSQSEQIINTYGKGGDYQLAVRAVTGVLQGLATGNQNAAWVNGLSPYANNLIKTYTTDEQGQVNTTANLMAHAMLGALEAYATGNHAEVGAAGAITSEVAAKLITEQLYHTEPDKLTDDQKQVVATLSQVTAGLAGIIASDSTQSAVSAAEIGKRAVENNLLSRQEDKQVYDITEEYRSKGMLPKYKQEQVSALLAKDTEIDRLLYLYQTEPEKLTEAQKAYLDRELKVIAASYDIPVENLYQWDFSQVIKRDDSALKNYLSSGNALNDSYDMKQAQSLKQGLEVASVTGVNYGLVNRALGVLPKVGQAIEKYPLLTEMGATAIANTGYQLSQDRPYDPYGLLQAELSTVLTRNRSLGQQVSINVGISTLSAENDEDYGWNALGAGVGTLGSNYASKFNFGNKYGNQFLKPIFSNYTGEYLGDSDRIKLNINRVGGDIDENR